MDGKMHKKAGSNTRDAAPRPTKAATSVAAAMMDDFDEQFSTRIAVQGDDTLDAITADGSTAGGTRRSTGDTQKMGESAGTGEALA